MANLGLSSPILWPTPRRLLAPARRFYLSDTETAQSASLPGMAFRTDPIPSRSSRHTTPGYVIGDALQHGVELCTDAVKPEQLEQARRELRELAQRQELARRTLEMRRRPEVLALLDDHFQRLGLLDPERHIRIAIAGYPTDAIVDGLLIFDAKRRVNTLPDGADARYLLGIVKNVSAKTEGEILAETLYRGRMEIRDRFLAPLRTERDALRSEPDVLRLLLAYVEKATSTPSNLERTFWLDAIVESLREQADADRERLYLHAARLIEATYAITARERHDAVRYVADRLVPLT